MATLGTEIKKKQEQESQSHNKIVLFLNGQSHSNFLILADLMKKIKQVLELKIPIVIGFECDQNITLDQLINLFDNEKLNFNEFPAKDAKEEEEIIGRFIANKGILPILKLIQANNIPFLGIDMDTQKRHYAMQDLASGARWIANVMAGNIMKGLNLLKESGGVMFVIQLGAAHVENVAAKIHLQLRTSSPEMHEKIRIIPTRSFLSETFKEENAALQQQLHNDKTLLDFLRLSGINYCAQNVLFKQDPKTLEYSSAECDALFNDGLTFIGRSPNRAAFTFSEATRPRLEELQTALGQFNNEKLLEVNPKTQTASVPISWLEQLWHSDSENLPKITHLATALSVKPADILKKIKLDLH